MYLMLHYVQSVLDDFLLVHFYWEIVDFFNYSYMFVFCFFLPNLSAWLEKKKKTVNQI